jgi:hypothetical protein
MAYTESDLVVPALEALRENTWGLRTEDLIRILTERLEPADRDREILSGRSDAYFSQKVRNLKTHNTLERRGLATALRSQLIQVATTKMATVGKNVKMVL